MCHGDGAIGGEARRVTISEVLTEIGFGRYHGILFGVCGVAWLAQSVYFGLLALLKQEVIKEWDLDAETLTLLQAAVFVGEFLGCSIWGPLSDRMGRCGALLLSNLLLTLFGVLTAAAPSPELLILAQGLVGIAVAGVVIPTTLLTESLEARHRKRLAFCLQYFWAGGSVYVNLVGALVLPLPTRQFQPWRLLALLAALPIALACFGWLLIDESPTWLQDVGREAEAIRVLHRIAERSGVTLCPFKLASPASMQKASPVAPLQQPYRCRTFVFSAVWFLGFFGYFGASLADTKIFSFVPGHTNYGLILFSACGEFFAVAIMHFMSERSVCLSMGVSFAVAGLAVYAELLDVSPDLLAVIVFVGRAGVMGACVGYWAATGPAFPSRIRCTAVSYAAFCGHLGGLLATLVAALSLRVQVMAFGSANVLAAVVVFALQWHLRPHEDSAVATDKLPEGTSARDASGTAFSQNTKTQPLLSGA